MTGDRTHDHDCDPPLNFEFEFEAPSEVTATRNRLGECNSATRERGT